VKRVFVHADRYADSVLLMEASRDAQRLPGVADAVVVMGTPANVERLRALGYDAPGVDKASANDLIVALDAEGPSEIEQARARIEEVFARRGDRESPTASFPVRTLSRGLERLPGANLAVISVPGRYAAREARRALHRGLHVLMFSDNVTIEEEIALKDEALTRGLLMMGPDCGTAILAGVPVGFANVVARGTIGIVGASGTGIQEISCAVDRLGGGISHAIGTGGRDLDERVGGKMSVSGIAALAEDPLTEALVVVSKRPSPKVADRVLAALVEAAKPAVACFLGGDGEVTAEEGSVPVVGTLARTAVEACRLAGLTVPPGALQEDPSRLRAWVCEDAACLGAAQRCGRGLFAGGSLCQEAAMVLAREGLEVSANVGADGVQRVSPDASPSGNVLWDLGDDGFTLGRPHPMIEPALRDEQVAQAVDDTSVGVLLLDVVIGYGSHEDPAGSLANAVREARSRCSARGEGLAVVASVTGTERDPQRRSAQVETLAAAGVRVLPSNAAAAAYAAMLLRRLSH